MRKLLGIIVAALAMQACSSINCPLNNTVLSTYRFYKANGAKDTLGYTLSIWSKRNDSINADTMLINQDVSVDSFKLPMSYVREADTLFFSFTDTSSVAYDTVMVRKKDWPHFEAPECNASFFHEILGVEHTRHVIDSIVINNKYVNYDATKLNFRIYCRNSSN